MYSEFCNFFFKSFTPKVKPFMNKQFTLRRYPFSIITFGIVDKIILKSNRMEFESMYSKSCFIICSADVLFALSLTCHKPVKPGLIEHLLLLNSGNGPSIKGGNS